MRYMLNIRSQKELVAFAAVLKPMLVFILNTETAGG
jgi:hypothetical protein